MDIGILGCGTIGSALAKGLAALQDVARIAVTTRTGRSPLPGLNDVIVLQDNAELAAVSDVVIVCVKPAHVEGVIREITDALRPGTLLVSVAAGTPTRAIQGWLNQVLPVVRAMPNMPCRIGAGMTALSAAQGCSDDHLATTRALFEPLGRVCIVEERLMDAVTAISGCGPAYVYLIAEALAEAGVKLGIPRATALELAAQTLLGSAAMVLQSGAHPAALRDEVTTPGGCTIDGLLALEDGGLRSTLVRGVTAASAASARLASG